MPAQGDVRASQAALDRAGERLSARASSGEDEIYWARMHDEDHYEALSQRIACTYDIGLDSIVLCRTFSFAMCQPPTWNRSGQQQPIEACHCRHTCVTPSMPRPPTCAGEPRLPARPNGCAASRACQMASDARCSTRSTTRK